MSCTDPLVISCCDGNFVIYFYCWQDVRQARRLDGFKGYYKIWKGVMVPKDEQEEEKYSMNELEGYKTPYQTHDNVMFHN